MKRRFKRDFYVDDDLSLLYGRPIKELKQRRQNVIFINLGW